MLVQQLQVIIFSYTLTMNFKMLPVFHMWAYFVCKLLELIILENWGQRLFLEKVPQSGFKVLCKANYLLPLNILIQEVWKLI